MATSKIQKVKILDCTIRDGGYINNWYFDTKLVREVYRVLSKSGVDIVEIGFRGTDTYFDRKKYGLWRFSPEEEIFKVVTNIDGAKVSLMADYGKIEANDFCDAKESVVDLIRVAVHKDNVKKAVNLLEQVKKKGYEVSLNVMGYTNYSERERKECASLLRKSAIDYVYVADSYGSLFPDQVRPLIEPLVEIGNFKVGFHPHNNLQMAFANTLEAIRCGVHIIDSTIYGMGRAAGNIPTETILSYLFVQGNKKYNIFPLLYCIEQYFLKIKKDTPWGYQLPYMISGIFNVHPNYPKELMCQREYNMGDIWKSLEYIKEFKPIGYDDNIIQMLVEKGFIGPLPKTNTKKDKLEQRTNIETLPNPTYINRHKGQNFLVLANGASLKENKPEIDKFIKKYKPVILGANFLGGLYTPDYHAFNSIDRLNSYIDTVSSASKILVGVNLHNIKVITNKLKRRYESLIFVNSVDNDFDIQSGIITSNCRTISVLLIGVAVVMGAERVFVAGMDGYIGIDSLNDTFFYEEKLDPQEHKICVERHRSNERFLGQLDSYIRDQGGEGVYIITPTNHLSFYKGTANYI